MTITQTDTVATTITASSAGKVSASAAATLKSDAAVSVPATFYDSVILENESAETWNEYEIQSPLGSDYTIENLSACQTLTGTSVTPVGDGGFGRVKVTSGSVAKILKCDTTKRGGQTAREFVEYTEGSISRCLYDQVAGLFDSTPDVDYYSTYNHATNTYTRNAACWAASIDLSCVAVASNDGSGWTRQRGGALITSRHILIARHFSYGIGTQVRFSNAAGTVETRTVIGTSAASSAGDMWVCALDAAVTVATPCSIAGTWIMQGLGYFSTYAQWYSGGLMVHIDQNAKVYAATLGYTLNKASSATFDITIGSINFPQFLSWGVCQHSAGVIPAEYSAMRHTPVSGDSGQPSFVIIDEEPVLLWCWHGSSNAPPAYQYNGAVLNALIASADANAGISTGYTVTVAPNPTL